MEKERSSVNLVSMHMNFTIQYEYNFEIFEIDGVCAESEWREKEYHSIYYK